MARIHRAGLRLDDAATAARVAVQMHQGERNRLIVAARLANLSLRQLGVIFGMSQVQVMRVLRQQAGYVTVGDGTVGTPK